MFPTAACLHNSHSSSPDTLRPHPELSHQSGKDPTIHERRGHANRQIHLQGDVWIFRLGILYKIDSYRDTVTCFTRTHRTKIVKVAKVRIICTRSSNTVILHHQQTDNEVKTIADAD